jgi:hypothetical protein
MEEKTTPGSRYKNYKNFKEVPVPFANRGVSTIFELA